MNLILLISVLCTVKPSKSFTMSCKPSIVSYHSDYKLCKLKSLETPNTACIDASVSITPPNPSLPNNQGAK